MHARGFPEGRLVPSRRIADDLRERIRQGEYQPGQQLPSERSLAASFSTARNTATAALSILQREGLVDRRHGSGWYVRQRRPLLRLGADRYSRARREQTGMSPFRAEVVEQGRVPRVDCTSITKVEPPADVTERLGVSPTTKSVVRRENWYFADEEPVQVGITYIPWEIAKGSVLAKSAAMGRGSLYARFEELGHSLTRIREEVTARMPTPEESRDLRIPDGVPVIEVLHTGIDQDGKPFEVTRFVMRADSNALDYSMPVED
jgi:GntR family transcriptional regulator